jgi:CheY-like chemotaxis protein
MAGPDLVLLGLMMPVVDSFEFVERLQADDRFRDVPVVVLTAKKLSGEEKAFLHSRTQSVIQKGSEDREALLRLARRLLAVSPAGARLISP